MRAVLVERFGETPRVAELAEPLPEPDGVVIRVEATGLCRSDWHAWAGHDDSVSLPNVPGHEFVGVVGKAGRDVRRFAVGDRVTTPFVCACGMCPECLAGNGQVCRNQQQPGFTRWGSFAELVAIGHADVNLVRIPTELDAGAAAGLGCRFATAYRGLVRRGRLVSGETIVIVGCGGVGLSAVMIAAGRGARVIAVDIDSDALRLASRFGAERTVDTAGMADDEALAAIAHACPDGADLSVEALGRPETAWLAISSLRRLGRHVQIGLFASAPSLPMPAVIDRELELIGSHGMPASDYPGLVDEVVSGRLPAGDLVTATIGLDEAPAALAGMSGGTAAGVTMIRP